MKKRTKKQEAGSPSFQRGMKYSEAKNLFLHGVPTQDDESAIGVRGFVAIMDHLMVTQPTFTFNDVTRYSRNLGLPFERVQELFKEFTDTMVQCCKLERQLSCFDCGEVYIVQ
jgi:hypothetical protein